MGIVDIVGFVFDYKDLFMWQVFRKVVCNDIVSCVIFYDNVIKFIGIVSREFVCDIYVGEGGVDLMWIVDIIMRIYDEC